MFDRYAIYYTAQGDLASRGASWLGWDVDRGRTVNQPLVAGLDVREVTQAPRKYGFHGTLKPPFVLANDSDETALRVAVRDLANQCSPISLVGLEVAPRGRFLALVPLGDTGPLEALAAKILHDLDPFRAPMSAEEQARREKPNLTVAQLANLHRWGYPHVMDKFRFHMTLTGRMPRTEIPIAQRVAIDYLSPVLPTPFDVDAITLVGQRADGMFATIERFALGGAR